MWPRTFAILSFFRACVRARAHVCVCFCVCACVYISFFCLENQWELWYEYVIVHMEGPNRNVRMRSRNRGFAITLTHWSLEIPKRVTGKQCRPRSECGVWTGSPHFANSLAIFLYVYLNRIDRYTYNWNWTLPIYSVGESIRSTIG